MKVIDLLNKIANGEKVPKRIKFENYIYIWRDTQKDYFCEQINHSLESVIGEYLFSNLNLEVEILEEPKGIPEKLEILPNNEQYSNKVLYGKINEIIDYLESKGE